MDAHPLRIMTADDHPIVREGLAAILSTQSDMALVAEAADGNQAVDLYRKHRPDVTLLDIHLLGVSGLEVIARIKKEFPGARFLILTSHAGDALVQRALKAGANGYLLKNSVRKELLDSIRAVYKGHRRIPTNVASSLAEYIAAEMLTAREIQVLSHVADGTANKNIADRLFITEDTVKAHMKNILSKLGANDRTHAVTIAMRRGILEFEWLLAG